MHMILSYFLTFLKNNLAYKEIHAYDFFFETVFFFLKVIKSFLVN